MSTIGGSSSGWKARGDTGRYQFNLSQERWNAIFGRVCCAACDGVCEKTGLTRPTAVLDES